AVLAGEAQRIPLLRLAAVLALPSLAADLFGYVVDQPSPDLAELFDRLDAGFLVELAQRRRIGLFAVVDAALRQLPDMGPIDVLRAIGSSADENQALTIDNAQAGAGAIRQGFVFWHGLSVFRARMVCAARNPYPYSEFESRALSLRRLRLDRHRGD